MDKTTLENIYGTMLKEGTDQKTVGKKQTELDGAEKAKIKPLEKQDGVPTPSEGKSNPDIEEGKGKPLCKKTEKTKESQTIDKPKMSFNAIYDKIIKEGDELESVEPADDIEGDNFDDKTGEFDPEAGAEEGDVNEEMDLASELRLLADRLSEIAEKLSMDDGLNPEEALGDEGLTDDDGMGDEGMVTEEPLPESVQLGKTPQPTTLKKFKKTTLGPKTTQNPKNTIGKSGAGRATVTSKGKDTSGRLSSAPKTQFGPNMSKTVSGRGPSVTGKGEAFIK